MFSFDQNYFVEIVIGLAQGLPCGGGKACLNHWRQISTISIPIFHSSTIDWIHTINQSMNKYHMRQVAQHIRILCWYWTAHMQKTQPAVRLRTNQWYPSSTGGLSAPSHLLVWQLRDSNPGPPLLEAQHSNPSTTEVPDMRQIQFEYQH